MKLNLAECFFQKAAQQPHHPLILGPGTEDKISYVEFREEIRALAKQLRDAGVNKSSNIGLHYQSGRDYVAFVYAIWACGACVTPLPRELTAPEKQQIFQFIHIDAVISSTDLLEQISPSLQPARLSINPSAVFASVDASGAAPVQLAEVNAAFYPLYLGHNG